MDEHDIYSLRMVGCCASGTSAPAHMQDMKPGQVSEEEQWNHYNKFVFLRCESSIRSNLRSELII